MSATIEEPLVEDIDEALVELDFGESSAPLPERRKYDVPPITNLADLWDDDAEDFKPTMLEVEGGEPLLYEGCSHLFFGTGGSGKSMLAQHTAVQVLAAGGRVLYLDYENSPRNLVSRLKALGAERSWVAERLGYWRLNEDLRPWVAGGLGAWIAEHPGVFVVLDGVAKSIAASGYDEDKNHQVVLWDDAVIVPITNLGATVGMVDHVVKPPAQGGGGAPSAAELFPRGAGAKINNVSGAAYLFRATKAWTKSSSGWAEVWTAKDREGERRQGSLAAKVEVTVTPSEGSVRMRLYAPEPMTETASGKARQTANMEKLSRWLEAQDGPVSRRELESDCGVRKAHVGAVLDVLREEGYITTPAGKPIEIARPYRQADDPQLAADGKPAFDPGEPF